MVRTVLVGDIIADYRFLKDILQKAEGQHNPCEKIWLSRAGRKIAIETANIIYCASTNSYTDFFLSANVANASMHKSSVSIKDWEQTLAGTGIYRIHNRFLANLQYIDKYTANGGGAIVTLKNGIELPVSKSRRKRVKEQLKLYINHRK